MLTHLDSAQKVLHKLHNQINLYIISGITEKSEKK